MKEAIANAGVFNLIIIFVIILMAFFIGSLGYSKAFKVKNKIIEEIEREDGNPDLAIDQIDNWLAEIGYRVNSHDGYFSCNTITGNQFVQNGGEAVNTGSDYQYCIYKFSTCKAGADNARCGTYYRAVAYMYFDVPVISELIRIPVTGETKTFMELNS